VIRELSKDSNLYPVYHFEPPINDLQPSLENIIRSMGYANSAIPDGYGNLLDDLFLQVKNIIAPQCGFIVLPEKSVTAKPKQIILNDKVFETNRIIAAPLKKMEKIVIFVATIGDEFDRWSKNTFDNGDLLEGYLIDLLGSEIAESAADWIEAKINQYAKNEELACSNRYSPGYCGWNVAEQRQLFDFLPANFCNISLTDSALMTPHKSVSGIIGIGKNMVRQNYPCAVCKVEHCYKNR
jgi:hypothetical protein